MERYEGQRMIEAKKDNPSWRGFLSELEMTSRINSPSRYEGGMRNYLHRRLGEMGIASTEDAKGNLLVLSDGPEGDVLLSAHMDKIGAGSEIRIEGETVIGRLDDAFGLSLIMEVLKEGLRPSVLFTVEEESTRQVIDKKGEKIEYKRPLAGEIHNAGARSAMQEIYDGAVKKPALIIFVDTSAHDQIGKGPLVSKSSFNFPFPVESMKSMAAILRNEHVSVRYWDAGATDAIEASFLPEQPAVLIEVATEQYHTDHEVAHKNDILDAIAAVKALITHKESIAVQPGKLIHAHKGDTIISDK